MLGGAAAVVAAVVLAWVLTDGPPRPQLVPTTATSAPPASTPIRAVASTVYRPRPVPAGFALVFERDAPEGPDAHLLHYERPRAGQLPDSLDVLTVQPVQQVQPVQPGADATTTSRPAGTDAVTTPVRVHGHDGVEELTTLPGPVRTLTWTEAPGLQLRIVATGAISVDELHRVADSLAPS